MTNMTMVRVTISFGSARALSSGVRGMARANPQSVRVVDNVHEARARALTVGRCIELVAG